MKDYKNKCWLLYTLILVLHSFSVYAQRTDGEFQVYIINPEEPRLIEIDNVGGAAWGEEDYNLTTSYNSGDTTNINYFLCFCENPLSGHREFGYARYRVRIAGGDYTYVDFRDTDYFGEDFEDYEECDLTVHFDWTKKHS